MGVSGDSKPCMNTLSGRAGANSICENRYTMDIDRDDRMRIDGEIDSPSHNALLADSAFHPKTDLDISNKEKRSIQRPSGTVITDSWNKFFDPSATVVKIANSGFRYWTGLTISATISTLANCEDWASDADMNIGALANQAISGGSGRFRVNDASCGISYQNGLLCITH